MKLGATQTEPYLALCHKENKQSIHKIQSLLITIVIMTIFRSSGMSVSPRTLECPSVPQLWNVYKSQDSGMSNSPATLECLSVP